MGSSLLYTPPMGQIGNDGVLTAVYPANGPDWQRWGPHCCIPRQWARLATMGSSLLYTPPMGQIGNDGVLTAVYPVHGPEVSDCQLCLKKSAITPRILDLPSHSKGTKCHSIHPNSHFTQTSKAFVWLPYLQKSILQLTPDIVKPQGLFRQCCHMPVIAC